MAKLALVVCTLLHATWMPPTGCPNVVHNLTAASFKLLSFLWVRLLANREEGEKECGCLPCLKLALGETTHDALSNHIMSSWGEKQMHFCCSSKKKSRTTLADFPGVRWHKAGNGNVPATCSSASPTSTTSSVSRLDNLHFRNESCSCWGCVD